MNRNQTSNSRATEPPQHSAELSNNESWIHILSSALPWAISVVLHIGLFLILVFAVVTIGNHIGANPDLDFVIATSTLSNKSGNPNPGVGTPNLPTAQDRFCVTDAKGYSQEQSDGRSVYAGQLKNDSPHIFGQGRDKGRIAAIGGGGNSHGGGGLIAPLGPKGGSGDVKFFNIRDRARNICYVIDRSGSMLERLDWVKREVLHSIRALDAPQTFHTIFYSSGEPVENPPKKLVLATPTNIRQAADFLREVTAEGQTDPIPAMEQAFKTTTEKKGRVQVIYLLTDGEFAEEAVQIIRQMNPNKDVRINTLATPDVSEKGIEILKEIAEESGGQFRLIPFREELGEE